MYLIQESPAVKEVCSFQEGCCEENKIEDGIDGRLMAKFY